VLITIRCLLLTSISTCFGHHYAHLQENKNPVTAFGVLSGSAGCVWLRLWGAVLQGVSTVEVSVRHPAEPQQYTKYSNRVFVLPKMGIMMPETC